MRRAEWRKPVGGADLAVFLRSVNREALLRSPWTAILYGLLLYFGPPVVLGFVVNAAWGPCTGFLAVLLGLGLYPKLIEPLVHRASHRPLGALEDLLPLPLPPSTFPVAVTVRYGSSITGLDEASASFVEGWLHVEGKRTSFSLRAVDGRAEIRRGVFQIALPEFQTITLDLILDRGLDVYSEFRNAASHWISAAERPEGEPILPPLGTLPFVYRGWATLGVGGALLAVAMVVLEHGIGFGSFALPATLAMALGALAFCRMMFMTRGQEEADRRAKALALPHASTSVLQESISP